MTTTLFASIGIDIGKEDFHIAGFGTRVLTAMPCSIGQGP
jgi:hypothetical protein